MPWYLSDRDQLWSCPAGSAGTAVTNLGCLPVADLPVGEDALLLAEGPEVVTRFEQALDEWLVLMANALVGMGARALEIGVEYVKERHAFGAPIGSFQAVAHGLADAATSVDGGGLLAREAAWAATAESRRFPGLAAMACAFSCRVCPPGQLSEPALPRRIRVHARVRHPALFPPGQGVACAVRRTRGALRPGRGPPPVGHAHGAVTMDFRLGERSEGFRQEARDFLDEALTDDVRDEMERTGVHHSWAFHRKLVERGWLAPGWPEELGGQGRDPLEMLAFMEEFHRAGAPTYAVGTTLMVANIIRHSAPTSSVNWSFPRRWVGRSSSSSASPNPSRVPTWPPPRPGRFGTASSG